VATRRRFIGYIVRARPDSMAVEWKPDDGEHKGEAKTIMTR